MNILYDYSQGFPEHWVTTPLEKQVIDNLFRKHYAFSQKGMIVNMAWGDRDKMKDVAECIAKNIPDAIIFYNLVDDYDSNWSETIRLARRYQPRVIVVGNSPYSANYNIPFWALAVDRFFTEYQEQDLLPTTITNAFLCYNRKPHTHRVKLYEKLKEQNLLDLGVFTLGDREGNSVSFDSNGFSGQEDTFTVEDDTDYGGIPNDLMSLGSIDVWQKSLLCIVNETAYRSGGCFPFITEKTWKPIVGLRPFVVVGSRGTSNWLQNNGFYVFNRDFGLPENPTPDQVAKLVGRLRGRHYNLLYDYHKEAIVHNAKRFREFCKEQSANLGLDQKT
jgi:hypothetical protein